MSKPLSQGPYKVYDVLSGELLGGYDSRMMAEYAHKDQPITIIYRPGRKKKVNK